MSLYTVSVSSSKTSVKVGVLSGMRVVFTNVLDARGSDVVGVSFVGLSRAFRALDGVVKPGDVVVVEVRLDRMKSMLERVKSPGRVELEQAYFTCLKTMEALPVLYSFVKTSNPKVDTLKLFSNAFSERTEKSEEGMFTMEDLMKEFEE